MNDEDGSIVEVDSQFHGYGWTKVVSSHLLLTSVVQTIVNDNPLVCKQLSDATDATGRTALQVAIPECRKLILESLYFFKRYEILTTNKPHYQSQTCIIHIATDHHNNANRSVALKFMKNRESFNNEVNIRSVGNFDLKYVIEILEHYDSDVNEEFKKSIIQRGFSAYPYLVVMHAADRNLNEIVSYGELIDHSDMYFICDIITQIARCLNHLHSKNYCHGDIKPKNIMRSGGSYLLIDLDGGGQIGSEYSCNKISSAYSPPEYLRKIPDELAEYEIKQTIPVAHPSQDSWALGMTLFFLLTSGSFFQHDSAGENLTNESDFQRLFEFSPEFKRDKLKRVSDLRAANLLSGLLHKDPTKRLSMPQVLSHPFVTGKLPSRMIGDKPEFDVFISYRVASDSSHAQLLCEQLTRKGLKVWLDVNCLEFGKPWEEGFIDGLFKSRVFVPILSRTAFVNNNYSILTLTNSSPVDNVLLEYRIAAELQKRNMVELICPVMIGDFDNKNNNYSNYFKSGSHPNTKTVCEVVVSSIEKRVLEVLDSESLGMPLFDCMNVKSIIEAITVNQGCFIEGEKTTAFDNAVNKIVDAVTSISTTDVEVVDNDPISTIDIMMDNIINIMNKSIPVEVQETLKLTLINNFRNKLNNQ